jgi:hypothetical protein
MIITDAIEKAPSEHAVYFLLTAYLEAIRVPFPESVCSFPIKGKEDVEARLSALHEIARNGSRAADGADEGALNEAALVFATALRQLEMLASREDRHPRTMAA